MAQAENSGISTWKRPLAVGFAIGAVVLALGFAIRVAVQGVVDTPKDFVVAIGEQIGGFLNAEPQITNDVTITFNGEKSIFELALIEEPIDCDYKMENVNYLSIKTLLISAKYKVKYGFDLQDGFEVELDEENRLLVVSLPEAKVLSSEMLELEKQSGDNGWWNKLTEADRLEGQNFMSKTVRLQAAENLRSNGTQEEMEKRIQDCIDRAFESDGKGLEPYTPSFQYIL